MSTAMAVAEVDGHRRLVGQRIADQLGDTGTVRETERQITPVRRAAEVSRVLVQPPQQRRVRGTEASASVTTRQIVAFNGGRANPAPTCRYRSASTGGGTSLTHTAIAI